MNYKEYTVRVYTDGDKYWYLDGIQYAKKEYYRELVKKGLITPEEAFLEIL